MQQLQPGTTLQGGKYMIDRVLGQGGFGITYLATHSILEKQVAIKEFFPKDFCERDGHTSQLSLGNANTVELVAKLKIKFLKEAKNISKLSHPNIVAIHDIFEENGTAYYLMDYIEGTSLGDKIKAEGAITETEAIQYIRTIGGAIAYMHGKSMNHLDIKPTNIMLRASDDAPILIDFGLAKQYDTTGDQTSTTPVGISHGYAPIEQYRPGGVATFTPQTDIYALGATLYSLLSGATPPHYSDILEDGLPELPSYVSAQTVAAIEKAMEIKKAKRPASIEEFLSLIPTTSTFQTETLSPKTASSETKDLSKEVNSLCTDKLTEGACTPIVDEISFEGSDNNEVKSPKIEKPGKAVAEETVILYNGESGQSYGLAETDNRTLEEIDYVDLGLSVKWASKIIGLATPNDDTTFSFRLSDGQNMTPSSFLANGQHLPTVNHIEELLEKCCWNTFYQDGKRAYRIIGPNGNSIIMPIRDIRKFLTFQTLWPDALGFCYYFILGEYAPSISKAPRADAFIWPVKK